MTFDQLLHRTIGFLVRHAETQRYATPHEEPEKILFLSKVKCILNLYTCSALPLKATIWCSQKCVYIESAHFSRNVFVVRKPSERGAFKIYRNMIFSAAFTWLRSVRFSKGIQMM